MKTIQLILSVVVCFISLNSFSQNCGLDPWPGCNPPGYGTTPPIESYAPYNCNQYVRAGVIEGLIDLSDGHLKSGVSANYIKNNVTASAIHNDNMWIEVPQQYGQAISTHAADHSALILAESSSYPFAFASTPGYSSPLYSHSFPSAGSGSCGYDYYAYMDGLSYSGSTSSMSDGVTRQFRFYNKPSYVTITWQVGPGLTITGGGNGHTYINVKATCGSNNVSSYVRGVLSTSCTNSSSQRTFSKNFTVNKCPVDCGGTINGSTLYTFNYVSQSVNHIDMNNNQSWTWVKNSGSVNYWYTQNSGRDVYFSLNPGGYVAFSAWTSGCNNSYSFSRSYYGNQLLDSPEELPVQVEYNIYDMASGVTSSGKVPQKDLENIKKGLPPGLYVITIGDKKEKVLVQEER